MKKVFAILLLGAVCGSFGLAQTIPSSPKNFKKGVPEGTPIEITADGENRFEAGMAYASGNVVVHYGSDVLYADKIAYNSGTKEVTAMGSVRIYSKGQVYRADQATYNFETQKMISGHFYTVQERFFASGDHFETMGQNHYQVKSGLFTTDDRQKPSYWVKSDTVEIYPDDRVVLKNSVVYVEGVPVFWVPYSFYSLNRGKEMFDFSSGSTGKWGPFALVSYNWQANQRWSGSLNFDYRNKRGFGGGVDANYFKDAANRTIFKSFWTHDKGTDIDVGSPDRPTAPPAKRFRFMYKQNVELSQDIYSMADVNVWSDRHVTQDFFPKEYETERVPDNFVNLMYYNPNFTVTAMGRSQVNGLFEVAERKPEVLFEFKRQQIPGTPLYYEGESSMVNFERVFDRDDPRKGYRAVRYDTFHQILMPKQYFGWLSLTPRAGVRGTVYTRNNDLSNSDPQASVNRYVLNAGAEASFKISRSWLDAKKDAWGIDGLRHVAEPFVNFSYVPEPNKTPQDFQGFDNRIANTIAQPLNFPAFNSIDSIDKMTTVRHGIRNKIQTKRDGANVDLIDWVVFSDLNLTRTSLGSFVDTTGEERELVANHPYTELYNNVGFYPVPWLKFNVDAATKLVKGSYNEVDTTVTWQVHPSLEISAGHRYLDGLPFFDDSNLITFGTFYRLNENWQFSQQLAFEGDDGTLQEQRYSIYRDLTSWNLAITTAVRNNKNVKDEFLAYFSLTLKAFPEQSISVNY